MEEKLTGIAVEVEVVVWVASTFAIIPESLSVGAVCEWNVPVTDIVEEVNLLFGEEKRGCDGVDRSISPSLIKEAAFVIKVLEEITVCLGTQPVQVTNFEVGPLVRLATETWRESLETHKMAVVVGVSTIVANKAHRIAFYNIFWLFFDEFLHAVPQCRNCFHIFKQTQHERVLFVVVGHEFESIIVNITKELNAGLNAPVPLILQHKRLLKEEARLEPTHVPVAHGIAIDDLPLTHILTDCCSLVCVNPLWKGPMLFTYQSIFGSSRHEVRCHSLEIIIKGLVV